MDADFKKQALVDISEQLIRRWIGITNMYNSAMLNKCLDVFSNNTSLVFWLRDATNGVLLYIHNLHIYLPCVYKLTQARVLYLIVICKTCPWPDIYHSVTIYGNGYQL